MVIFFYRFKMESAAITRNMKSVVPPPNTYSVCCHRKGHVSNSGKSGLIKAVPDAIPPGMYDQSALLNPYAVVNDFEPTPDANEAVFVPG
jgi:hypothetical protein